jgi:uncharacterized protein (TIGR00375 family)
MRFIADLHIHSGFSRATSREISLENIWKWAQFKGITVVGTGDFTHPLWRNTLKEKLYNNGNNVFNLKNKYREDILTSCRGEVFFMLTSEVSCIYTKSGKVRKIHNLIFVPDFAAAQRVSKELAKIGNLESDGRPILGLDAKVLLKIVLDSSDNSMLVPAHAWTPHFSVFGASSGFDSLEECFDELTPNIHAIETGLSSDPSMNWRLSALDGITLISNSDAHSPAKLGREANIFDTDYATRKGKRGTGDSEISYQFIMDAIKTRKGFIGTIEFFPEEGKYHYDGHRACGVSLSPSETMKRNYMCPVCGKKVTVGVLHRVEKLADRKEGFRPKGAAPFYSIIPLPEIIAEIKKVGVNSKTVREEYFRLIEELGSEFRILLDTPPDDIERATSPLMREAMERMRSGNVHIVPGFDGEYGKVRIFEESTPKYIG